ncbi:CsiV family protein [Porticoccus sp. W117]|uniref:CsiV family protein n=1 Tax=Porticoccus sp. W117 TaxID=3054777 RepID=UPI002591A68D|nr:CsiV family protein [Porticoccus sp. W117]MDM3869935.1 CsiV family protein [Porticoccus sp. W117]
MRDERRKTRLGSGWPLRLPSLVSRLPLLLLALPATAADDAEKWYQVEVIIFQQTDHYGQEKPRRDVTLQYPGNHLELFDPNKIIDEAESEENSQEGDSEVVEVVEQAPAETPTSILFTQEPEQPEPEKEKPFQVLESDQRQLNNYATALRRRSGYQVLYHQAWRQPGIGFAQAPWILVRAGDRYGEHFQLEGSLRLVRSRYLHLETNLWLSRFVENLDQQQPGFERFEGFENFEGAEDIWPLLPEYPIADIEPQVEITDELELSPDSQNPGEFEELTLEPLNSQPLFQIGELIPEGPQYKADEINLFKTSRRMRRDELHYLDHPKMGVLVQVTHYEVPEPKAEVDEPVPAPLLLKGSQ